MASTRTRTSQRGTSSRKTRRDEPRLNRTGVVWLSFVAAMSLLIGLLSLGDGRLRPTMMAARPSLLAPGPGQTTNGYAEILDHCPETVDGRWRSIIIHHSGTLTGDLDHLDAVHLRQGIPGGLAYHFAIGRGGRLGLGQVAMTQRWKAQEDSYGVSRPDLGWTEGEAISICLIGRGNDRPFENRQIESLVDFVRFLQRSYGIPADRVYLASDVAPRLTGPGAHFPSVRFGEAILN